jgi:hypothetical protein
MRLAHHAVAYLPPLDIRPDIGNLADELMA